MRLTANKIAYKLNLILTIIFFQSGIPTSVEQNLQFAHRFSELSAGLPNENVAATLPTEKRMSNAETNPVGALQERFQSRGIAPDFELIQSEGASHCPVFTYKVFIIILIKNYLAFVNEIKPC
jgi:hypothetical protein